MNNAKIAQDAIEIFVEETEDTSRSSLLEKQKGELTQIIEAIHRIEATKDWQKLKRLVLDGVTTTLERQLANAASAKEVDTPELYRLQGQLVWARKYTDLTKLADFFRQQLEHIKNQLDYETNPRDGAL